MPAFKPRNTPRARELRNAATPAERLLWRYLARSQLGVKFSRQMPVGPYFADFLCRELNLIVELDGFSHDLRQDHDARRDGWLQANGFRLVRFTNQDVLDNVEGVVTRLSELIAASTHPQPLPQAGGARGGRLHTRP
ncbi:endonuclease domain-containing protein [Novosphingobium sp.]|uniref:endonuclease domain-containing protein n=1 Tax=Novosphingobium sp. TaxID=1874826 RepID=UPI0035AFF53D